jgi:hypothetical protein
MRTKRAKQMPSPATPPSEMSTTDRDALIAAYQAGVITSWKRDAEGWYRLTVTGRDDYVEAGKLMQYLAKLGAATS